MEIDLIVIVMEMKKSDLPSNPSFSLSQFAPAKKEEELTICEINLSIYTLRDVRYG